MNKKNRITIIGAGNGGMTAAYHLSRLGNEVCLYDQPLFSSQLEAIEHQGGIKAYSEKDGAELILPGFEAIARTTTCMAEAIAYSNLHIVIVPSFAQEELFRLMLPHLKSGDTVFTMPGNFAGLVYRRMQRELGYRDKALTFVDAMTIPWACRLFEPACLGIMGLKKLIFAGVFPKKNEKQALERINAIFPIPVKALGNVIEAGMENINFGGHPLVTTLNIGLLETFGGQFNYYSDCVSPSIDRAASRMEAERQSIGHAMKLQLKSELDMMNTLYGTQKTSVFEFNKTSSTHKKIHSAPNSSKSRYITEDVPFLLTPCYEFAKLLEINVPIMESCIRIASTYNDTDYFTAGRTLESMGLVGKSIEEILTIVS
jgi:opine dehydrogenase